MAPDPTGVGSPLIVTATLDRTSWEYFEAHRRAHFPPERNVLAAHLTLFHRLPDDRQAQILDGLTKEAATVGSMAGRAGALRSLGQGVAFDIECAPLLELRRRLAGRWAPLLGAQDRSWRRPHVTIQNKVTPPTARALLERLHASFAPFAVEITGVALWRYLDGPWQLVTDVPFVASS